MGIPHSFLNICNFIYLDIFRTWEIPSHSTRNQKIEASQIRKWVDQISREWFYWTKIKFFYVDINSSEILNEQNFSKLQKSYRNKFQFVDFLSIFLSSRLKTRLYIIINFWITWNKFLYQWQQHKGNYPLFIHIRQITYANNFKRDENRNLHMRLLNQSYLFNPLHFWNRSDIIYVTFFLISFSLHLS